MLEPYFRSRCFLLHDDSLIVVSTSISQFWIPSQNSLGLMLSGGGVSDGSKNLNVKHEAIL